MARTLALLAAVLAPGLAAVPAAARPAKPPGLAEKVNALLDAPEYRHATWGVLVVDGKTGEVVYERNPDTLLAPASVVKLFSCAAALVALGPDSTTETAVYRRGPVVGGVLRGDLILVAAGDLTLGGRAKGGRTVFKDRDHTYANDGAGDSELTDTDPLAGLDALAEQVKGSGVTQVLGEVLVDDRMFARPRATGGSSDAVSPIVVNDNVVDILVEPGKKPGDPARVTTRPGTAFYSVDALAWTGEEKSAASVQLAAVGPNQFAVRGTVPAGGKPVVRVYPVEDPALFARAVFIESLRRHGVKATAAVMRPQNHDLPAAGGYDRLTKVAAFTSPPLKEAVTVTLKVSHNLYATTLPCLVASARGFTTAEAGLREQGKILKELGVDVGQVAFAGGAGGANADHATPRATVQLLRGMAKRPEWEAYKAALPILGVDGTLAEAVGADSPARGKVFAKTGTLVWYDAVNDRFLLKCKALAGTMTTKDGRVLFFAAIVNNVPLPAGTGAAREGRVIGKLCELLYGE